MKKSIALTTTAALLLSCSLGAAPALAGSITGKVKFEGTPPERRKIQMTADPVCDKLNPEGRQGEVMVIGADGGIQNVIVHVKEGLPADKKFDTPTTSVVLDQKGCMYTPHVLTAQVDQVVEIKNSDATLHNVHALPTKSPQFNNAMPIQNQVIKKKFSTPEMPVHVKCDVHPWMSAYIGVFTHPFHAVTAADGSFTIDNVPAGNYTVEAWHENLGTKTASVTVADGAATADFSFAGK
ncbi:MAG TPA: carboxypeptidase regulatory-like domain-containing protein [Candidatus Limnocylindrales bacterium]|nr:carboxypeptidase regulatory-like domain-containing protein [Candidatus Limnocylindrales bacterium]